MSGLWRGLLVVALGTGCRGAPPAPPSGQLWLDLTPPPASVLVDDRPLLRQSDGTLRVSLPAGPHRVEAYAPGYFHAYRDVTVVASQRVQVKVDLRPDPDAEPEKSDGRLPLPGGRPATPSADAP